MEKIRQLGNEFGLVKGLNSIDEDKIEELNLAVRNRLPENNTNLLTDGTENSDERFNNLCRCSQLD